MTYALNFSKRAFKDLATINEPHYSAIKQAILHLTENPRPHGCKKLKGRSSYRIRAGEYRVIYEIFDTEILVEIIAVGHRKDIYR